MKISKFINKLVAFVLFDTFLFMLIFFSAVFGNSESEDFVLADEFNAVSDETSFENITYPHTKTFTISAYYSPLPCQSKYVTGSYEGDIRLNGSGVNGADGTPVYPGMIAAPRIYDFGTKMDVPGVGIVAVHDRGGAIVASNGQDGVYDRLDIWMGYGDKGLQRALNWGKRTLDVVVYGVNDSIAEQIILFDYSPDEANPNQCVIEPEIIDSETPGSESFEPESSASEVEIISTPLVDSIYKFNVTLQYGDSNNTVLDLQKELSSINYYKGEFTGIYDDLTEHAVYKFQQGQGIVENEYSQGAGIFGPKTRDALNEIVGYRDYTKTLIAQATARASDVQDIATADLEWTEALPPDDVDFAFSDGFEEALLTSELDFGMIGDDVTTLQLFLKDHGYFNAKFTTDYFGEMTRLALIDFQFDYGLISDPNDFGAGRVGPVTLELINSMI